VLFFEPPNLFERFFQKFFRTFFLIGLAVDSGCKGKNLFPKFQIFFEDFFQDFVRTFFVSLAPVFQPKRVQR